MWPVTFRRFAVRSAVLLLGVVLLVSALAACGTTSLAARTGATPTDDGSANSYSNTSAHSASYGDAPAKTAFVLDRYPGRAPILDEPRRASRLYQRLRL